MKTLRTTLLFAAGAALLGPGALFLTAADQPADRPAAVAKPGGPRHAAAAERLGLTDEQKTRLAGVRAKAREAVQAIRGDASLSAEQKRAKARETLKAARAEADAVFTPEQRDKARLARERVGERIRHGVKARIHERMAGWHGRQAGPGWGPPGPRGPGMAPFDRRFGPPMGMGFAPHEPRRPWRGGPGPMGAPQWGQGRMMERGFPPGARPGAGPEFGAGLQLSEEQRAKAAELRKKQQEKVAEVMKSGRDEFRALLTPEQQKKFDAQAPKPPAGR